MYFFLHAPISRQCFLRLVRAHWCVWEFRARLRVALHAARVHGCSHVPCFFLAADSPAVYWESRPVYEEKEGRFFGSPADESPGQRGEGQKAGERVLELPLSPRGGLSREVRGGRPLIMKVPTLILSLLDPSGR